jgi:serine phosphatase RsbU (regulator of sigma subunit)
MMVVVCLVSFVSAFSLINKTIPGFLIYKLPYVGSMGNSEWPGPKEGLKMMQRIDWANGKPVNSGADVFAIAKEKPPGTPIRYTVESEGQVRTVVVPSCKFTVLDFFLVFMIPFLLGTAIFCIGFIAYLLKPNVYTSWVFLFACLSLAIYMITGVEMQSTYRTIHLHYLVIPFMPASLVHFGLIFPERKKFFTRHWFLEYGIYFPALILAVGFQINLFNFYLENKALWIPGFRLVSGITRIFGVACITGLTVLLFHSLYKASSNVARQRTRMILFGIAIAFLPSSAIMLSAHFLKFEFPWNFLPVFGIFFPASIAYSIIRHNLFEADVIIQRTIGYAIVTAIVIGIYAGVSLTLNVFVGKYQMAQSRSFPILFTLGVILVFNPLRNRIQVLVDRIFFRKEYDYGAIVEKIGGAITSMLDLGQILKHISQTFMEDMFINTSSVMLLSPAGSEYQVFMADGERKEEVEKKAFKRDDPLMEIIEDEKRELTKYDVLEDPKYKTISESCVANFEALHASLMVPLVYQSQVIGSLNLGEKKSGKFYNRQDIELLRTLANQGAVAIENARLFQENLEKQRMEEELNIARDLQMSMLPATCPEIEGFEIVASSVPAREVGGDFFDFINMGQDRAGLVIGDVTGKSVSGALVMSASRSIFRMLSEESLSVGEIMTRANRRTKKDIKSGMFVALLYAVLDAKDRTLSLCSAGQTQPIHLSTKTGDAKLVETEGDTFPLGILEEANYEETRLQLEPGDKVILYTDGIVEAMNEQKEMFGFNRLLEVVQEASTMNADSLLKEILDKVNEFVGDAAQHDDFTVIVINILQLQ